MNVEKRKFMQKKPRNLFQRRKKPDLNIFKISSEAINVPKNSTFWNKNDVITRYPRKKCEKIADDELNPILKNF